MGRRKLPEKKRGDSINLIVKSNELVDAKYMFDIWETRFFHTLVSMINKNDDDEKQYRVYFKDVKRLFNIKSNQTYRLLREAARSLNRKPVYVGWMNDRFKRGREYNLFEFIDYLEEGQKGAGIEKQEYVDIKIHNQMKPFLLHVKKNFDPKLTRYTSYELRNIERLQPYGTRIYELFKQFEYKGSRELNIQELKERFLITDEYPRFSTFYQRVIMPSIKSINKHTDIRIPIDQIQKIKEGRKVVALHFIIESKTKVELATMRGELPLERRTPTLFDEERIQEKELYEAAESDTMQLFNAFESVVVQKLGVTPSVFLKMLESEKYSRKAIEQAINVTRRAKYNQEIKKSSSGFFIKALREGYTDEKEEIRKQKTTKEVNDVKRNVLEKELLETKELFSQSINDRIRELTANKQGVTEAAIKAIQDNPLMESLLIDKEREIGRALNIDDYRQDKRLRVLVISNIVQIEEAFFKDIMTMYQQKIQHYKLKIKALK